MNLKETLVKNSFHYFEPLNLKNEVKISQDESQTNFLDAHVEFLRKWNSEGKNGEMKYLAESEEVRKNADLILLGVQSALCFLVPYFKPEREWMQGETLSQANLKGSRDLGERPFFEFVSKYAQGKDYHKVISSKLNGIFKETEFQFRVVVDTVPFFDRAHARESGLGFTGKNTMLIRPGLGSYFFIATVLLTCDYAQLLESLNEATMPEKVLRLKRLVELDCGTCNKCVEACPTSALLGDYSMDASLCLSYQSIEKRGKIAPNFQKYFVQTAYGCDICQDVCPYNIHTRVQGIFEEFVLEKKLEPTVFEVATMSQVQYEKWFGGTALTRAKRRGLIRNALYILKHGKSESFEKARVFWKESHTLDVLSSEILDVLA